MLALAELSWGDWDDPPHELEQAINALIADRKLGSAEPLLTYGVLISWRHDPEKAIAYFMEALKYAPQDALVSGTGTRPVHGLELVRGQRITKESSGCRRGA